MLRGKWVWDRFIVLKGEKLSQKSNYRSRRRSGSYRSLYSENFWISMGLTLGLTVAFLLLKFPLYFAYMAGLNIVTFGYYGYDKSQAKKDGWRVPEKILHYLAVIGGAPGGILGMFVFNHKTSKQSFLLILGLSLMAHLIIFIFFNEILLSFSNWQAGIKALENSFSSQNNRR